MGDGVGIRLVGPGDASLFARVASDVFDGPVDPGRLTAYLATPGHLMILALAAGEVVGQIAGVIHRHPDMPDELYIDNLGVTPVLHRQGIGRRLVEALMAEAQRRGCREAWVATETENRPARALYRRLGPVEETRVAYYLYDL